MKILNTPLEDYHLHSSNFSDGFNSIDEIAQHAGIWGLKKLVITDHSQAALDASKLARRTAREIISRWVNIHNDVDISFGVEADLLNEQGDICDHIDGVPGNFLVLSYHRSVYRGAPESIAHGFINAMQRYGTKINIIGHICEGLSAEQAGRVIDEANARSIPLELNARYFMKTPERWQVFLERAELVYINSDAHTLYELKTRRVDARELLRKSGISL